MLETEEFEENQNNGKPKSYVVAGLTILIVGIASGAVYRYNEFKKPQINEPQPSADEPQTEAAPAVSGTSTSTLDTAVTTSPSLNPSPQGGGNGESKVEGNKAPPAVKVPSAKPVVPTAPKVNICEEAQKTRDQKYQQADAEYSTAHSAARQTFDAEQAQYETSLTALSRRRNDGINKYLTAIALATSKYNSSTEPNVYEIYQQEQSAALSAYTETTAGINTEESPILAAKKDSQTKYDAAVAAALAKRDGDKAAAEAEYATSTEGKSCKN